MKAYQLGLFFTVMTATTMAANAADMKGDWTGRTHTIIATMRWRIGGSRRAQASSIVPAKMRTPTMR